MSGQHYDIFFRGEVLDGFTIDQVKTGIAQLFKASPEKIEQLFSGKVVALRKGLDKPGALKFKQALENAGARIYVKLAAEESPTETTAKPSPKAAQTTTQPAQAASQSSPKTAAAPPTTPTPTTTTASEAISATPLDILPAGSDLLIQAERKKDEEARIDTSQIRLASLFDTFKAPTEPPPPAPDVSHLSTAAVGADVLEGYRNNTPPPPAPEVGHISLAAAGADVLEGYRNATPPPAAPDVDHISLAEVGADIDPAKKKAPPPAPDVSHIKLA